MTDRPVDKPMRHTVRAFDAEIRQLRGMIRDMGALAEMQINRAVRALLDQDQEAAAEIVKRDDELDQMEAEAEKLAIGIIALRSPLADDLREIVAALKISSVIERIGDYAKNVAKRVPVLAGTASIEPIVILPEMARAAGAMVSDALKCYDERDAELALHVIDQDEQVDDFYNSLFRSLLTYMMENPQHISASTHLLFIAKNLERVGDHATNIAEMVYYSVTGSRPEDRSKLDRTSTMTIRQEN